MQGRLHRRGSGPRCGELRRLRSLRRPVERDDKADECEEQTGTDEIVRHARHDLEADALFAKHRIVEEALRTLGVAERLPAWNDAFMKFLPGVAKKGMRFHPLAHTVEIVSERSLRFITLYHCARSADRNRHGQGVKNTEGNQQPETETGQSLGQRKCKGFRAHTS